MSNKSIINTHKVFNCMANSDSGSSLMPVESENLAQAIGLCSQVGALKSGEVILPGRNDETWKYSNLAQIVAGKKIAKKPALASKAKALLDSTENDKSIGYNFVIRGNDLSKSDSDVSNLPEGIELLICDDANNIPKWVKNAATATKLPQDISLGVGELSNQLLASVIVFKVSANTTIDEPINITHVLSDEDSSSMVLFYLEENSEITVIEKYLSENSASKNIDIARDETNGRAKLSLTQLSIFQQQQSRCHLTSIFDLKQDNHCIASRGFYIESGSMLNTSTLNLSDGFVRQQSSSKLAGSDIDADFDVLNLLDGSAHCDVLLRLYHDAPDCRSNQRVRSILNDKVNCAFQGKIAVAQAGQKTDAYQQSDARLMSDSASMNVKPELEIYADDVKCSHGSTIASVDESQLFYLASRGIPQEIAENMLLEGFLREIIDRNPSKHIKNSLLEALGFDQ